MMNSVFAMRQNALRKLKEHEIKSRREIILAAAQTLFSKQGISGVTMRDIAHKAGVSVGFIYRYFPGRTDIFVELFEAGSTTLLKRIGTHVNPADPRALHTLARTYITFMHENMLFFEMMAHFMLEGKLSDNAVKRVNGTLRQIMDRLEPHLDSGRKEGSRVLAHSFFAALNGVMISLVNYPGRTPQEVRGRTLLLAEAIAEQFSRGTKQ